MDWNTALIFRAGTDIRTNTDEPITPANGLRFTLSELCPLLGCTTIEVLPLRGGSLMLIDKEGKLTGKLQNDMATLFAQLANKIGPDDFIFGDVALIRDTQLAS